MKLTDSYYHAESGLSVCQVEHEGYRASATANVHPDDKLTSSRFFGCSLAEMRAQVKILKWKHQAEKTKCEEARKFMNACLCYKNFDKKSDTAKAMFRQLNKRIKAVNKIADEINAIEENIQTKIRQRDIVLKAVAARKGQEQLTTTE